MEKLGTYSKARGRWKGGKDREGQSFFPLADPRPKNRKGKEGWALYCRRTRRAKGIHARGSSWLVVRSHYYTDEQPQQSNNTNRRWSLGLFVLWYSSDA